MTVPIHDKVEFPEPALTLIGDRLQERRVELVVAIRETVPLKPPKGEVVTVKERVTLTMATTLEGAFKAKSWTWKRTLVECVNVPLVPVTVAL